MQNEVGGRGIVVPIPGVNTLVISDHYCLSLIAMGVVVLDRHRLSPLFNRIEFVSFSMGMCPRNADLQPLAFPLWTHEHKAIHPVRHLLSQGKVLVVGMVVNFPSVGCLRANLRTLKG